MWIFTPEGFVSAVEDRNDPTVIMVRARDRASLEHLCDVVGEFPAAIVAYTGTDYPYRVAISRPQLEAYVLDCARGVTYPNFKDEAHRVRGKAYADVLMRVWVAGLSLTPRRVARRQQAAYDARRAARGPGAFMPR